MMGEVNLSGDSYESFGCRLNAISPSDLFRRYEQAGFLYPAKMVRLARVFGLVEATWNSALRAGQSLLQIVTCDNEGGWASVAGWRSSHHGWHFQHLVASGNVAATRAVLLAAQAGDLRDQAHAATQNWFRANNRYAQRVFGSLVHTLGPSAASVDEFHYFAMPPRRTGATLRGVLVERVQTGTQCELCEFAHALRGRVYVDAEELRHDDFLLDGLDAQYRQVGLRRYRNVWLAHVRGRAGLAGVAIANRGPIGLNFSFLENRCEFLVDPSLAESCKAGVTAALLSHVRSEYHEFALDYIPVVVDTGLADTIRRLGGQLIRPYSQSIWLRAGYEAWYQHVDRFYQKVSRTTHRRGLGSPRSCISATASSGA